MARPKLKLNEVAIGDLAYIGCSTNEIALIIGCDDQTLHRRFSKVLAKRRAERRRDLRQLQLDAARNKNPAMLIWLGKQELDQVESRPPGDAIDLEAVVREMIARNEQLTYNPNSGPAA